MNTAAQCLKCGRPDARPFEVRLFRKLGVEYAPSIPGDAAIRTFTGYEPAAARTFHICARCQSHLFRAILVVPLLRIVGFVLITAGVILFWDRAVGDWQWALGLLEGWAVIYLGFPGLIVLGRIALMALLDPGEMRSELLIEAVYPDLDREFGDALAVRADRYTFDEIGVSEQVGKLHALTALEIAVLAPREAHMARLRAPSRPGDDETPLGALRLSAICAAIVGACLLLATQRLFPLMPGFILDEEEGRWDILIGFALAMPQVAIVAFAAIGALYMFGYAIWLWFYRRAEARRRPGR